MRLIFEKRKNAKTYKKVQFKKNWPNEGKIKYYILKWQ